MITLLLLALALFQTDNAGPTYCYREVSPGVWDECVLLVTGTAMTWKSWNGYTWAGDPYCVTDTTNFTLQPTSPAIDAGALIPNFHCPNPGSALNQPRLPDAYNSYCSEWYGKGPDIGACEYVAAVVINPPSAPKGMTVTLK